MGFCTNCGAKLDDGVAFCSKCGAKAGMIDNHSSMAGQSYSTDSEAVSSFLTSLKKTNQNGLNRLGANRNLFIFVFAALVLNFILLLCPTMSISALSIVNLNFSFTGIFSTANQFMSLFGSDSSSSGLTALSVFFVIGDVLVALSAVIMVFPLFLKGTYKAGYLTLAKLAALYTFIINLLLIIIVAVAVGSNAGSLGSFGLTVGGWLYIIVSIAWIISLFMLSSKMKKAMPAGGGKNPPQSHIGSYPPVSSQQQTSAQQPPFVQQQTHTQQGQLQQTEPQLFIKRISSLLRENIKLFFVVIALTVISFIFFFVPTFGFSGIPYWSLFSYLGGAGGPTGALIIERLIFLIGFLLIIAAPISILLPIFMNRPYTTKFFLIPKISAIYTLFWLLMMIIDGISSNPGRHGSVMVSGYLYLIVLIALIITTFMLSSKFRRYRIVAQPIQQYSQQSTDHSSDTIDVQAVTKSATQGDVNAQYELGHYYIFKTKDVDSAVYWLCLSEKAGNPKAKRLLEYLITKNIPQIAEKIANIKSNISAPQA